MYIHVYTVHMYYLFVYGLEPAALAGALRHSGGGCRRPSFTSINLYISTIHTYYETDIYTFYET